MRPAKSFSSGCAEQNKRGSVVEVDIRERQDAVTLCYLLTRAPRAPPPSVSILFRSSDKIPRRGEIGGVSGVRGVRCESECQRRHRARTPLQPDSSCFSRSPDSVFDMSEVTTPTQSPADGFHITRLRSKRLKFRRHTEPDHALCYSVFWQDPPQSLVDTTIEFLKRKYEGELTCAVDVGCGRGDSTVAWASHFKSVIGTDVDPARVGSAKKMHLNSPNVKFVVCPAESLSMGDETVQMLGSKAAHWFDIPAFFSEVYRVLAPGGVCALFNCKLVPSAFPSLSPQDEAQLMDVVKWADSRLIKYWPKERNHILEEYRSIDFPFRDKEEVRDTILYHDVDLKVGELTEYIQSWSAFQGFQEKEGEAAAQDFMQTFNERIRKVLHEATEVKARFHYFLLLGRKSMS
ncbi:unnamed protein product [Darwinula stevensoni]|uniref:Methyltransferase domain-containing protein n=1 Tax=Darwinula stevensoni TaxID=69355 RepID=A0A7R8X0R2_9CRUS|nr:unnamed protein product [Darwinula stevensoni]CAG0881942.1 unnamed protein product [Darwinula stevensoni]